MIRFASRELTGHGAGKCDERKHKLQKANWQTEQSAMRSSFDKTMLGIRQLARGQYAMSSIPSSPFWNISASKRNFSKYCN